MTYDPYAPEQQAKTGRGDPAVRSERGHKPATPVVPLSDSGVDAERPATPTTAATPTTPSALRTPVSADRDPLAGPVQDPVHPVHSSAGASAITPAAAAAPSAGPPAPATAPGKTPGATAVKATRLIPQDESDKLNLRLQEALTTFVDGPRRSVEEAAGVLEDAAMRLTAVLAERPRALRDSWDGKDGRSGGGEHGADTEDLRLALQSYREVTQRLLRI